MCAKFGCGPTVVSKKNGGYRQTDRQTDRQTKKTAAFYMYMAIKLSLSISVGNFGPNKSPYLANPATL